MGEQLIKKHITLTKVTLDRLDQLLNEEGSVKNYSDAIRFAILALDDKEKSNTKLESKINTMAKNIELVLHISGGGFHELGVQGLKDLEESFIYQDAKKQVDKSIQKQVTANSMKRTSNVVSDSVTKTKKQTFTL